MRGLYVVTGMVDPSIDGNLSKEAVQCGRPLSPDVEPLFGIRDAFNHQRFGPSEPNVRKIFGRKFSVTRNQPTCLGASGNRRISSERISI